VIDSSPKRISRLAVQNRRQEIEQRLAACGLARGPRRLFGSKSTVAFEKAPSRRLRAALEGLGPIFSSFGLYMSSRVDLWPAKDCLELATIPDKAATTPTNLVRKLLSDEVDCFRDETFSVFEAKPFESRLLFQSHYARLRGNNVVVKIIHPEVESQLLCDFDLLPLLKDSFAGFGWSDSAFKSVMADFGHSLDQQLDFVHEARAFAELAEAAEEYDALRAPQVYESLCTSKVLTVERLNGLRLDNILPAPGDVSSDADSSRSLRSIGFEQEEFARLLCEVWLRQALMGRCFPVDPNPHNIQVLAGKQIAFTGGGFAKLAAEPQANLWNYLRAAANQDSDKACSYLLRELRKEGAVRDDVRQRFRQAMPFRDGGWDAIGDRQSLAELLFVQWRFATEGGYTPLMHLPAFYRGLFNVADTTRRIAPRIDPLAEGVRDLRLVAGLAEFGKMMNQNQLVGQMDRYAALMMDLPQSLDDALTSASEGRTHLKSQAADYAGHRGARSSSAVVTALVLLLASVVLLSHYITSSVVPGLWANRINTIVFMLLGALLLRAVSGRHDAEK
jgi:predicted unusual protein kinase regulating ubiquinone biosynthesis (AarF/ABC1/UbiB family)